MNIFDLDNEALVCDSKCVRQVCHDPSHDSWSHYRKLLGIPPKVRKLTQREACLLYACAELHQSGYRKLQRIQVYHAANAILENKPETRTQIMALAGADKPLTGRELFAMAQQFAGRTLSKKTAYRRCNTDKAAKGTPRLSMAAIYTPEQARRLMRAIAA